MDLPGISAHPSLVVAGVLLIVYCVYGAVHRLFLSPIAHFPGPRLAALTFWYEFYYDVDLSRGTHLMKQFGWLYSILTRIPQKLVSIIHPLTKELFDVQNGITAQIEDIKSDSSTADPRKPSKDSTPPTILHDLLTTKNNLPAPELTTPRLTEEAFTLLGAGTVTTAHTLATTIYHLHAHPCSLRRLRAELAPLYQGGGQPTWTNLEQLPYLSAVLSEGLRLSYGVSHRLPRISPDTALRVPGADEGVATIPPGTPVSMTQMFLHEDLSIFPEPTAFRPERWLEVDVRERGSAWG
ncbi:hypothetical protein SLS57_011695 [Botryosphaeria dothidea]